MPRPLALHEVFPHRLKAARQMKELSQKQLGLDAGLDPFVASTRINRYEQGIHQPDLGTVERLAAALDVPPAYFFAGEERLARMILAFAKLPVSEKERLLREADG